MSSIVHVLNSIPARVVWWSVEGAMRAGRWGLLWLNGVEWDAEGQDLTAWLQRGMRGLRRLMRGNARCCTAEKCVRRLLLLESRGRWVVRVVGRRRVVVLPTVSSWASAWQRSSS